MLRTGVVLVFALLLIAAFSYLVRHVSSLEYCEHHFDIPDGCSASSATTLTCPFYTMHWIYCAPDMGRMMVRQTEEITRAMHPVDHVDILHCHSGKDTLQGKVLYYVGGNQTRYLLSGTVNHHSLMMDVESDVPLPSFVGNFFTIDNN